MKSILTFVSLFILTMPYLVFSQDSLNTSFVGSIEFGNMNYNNGIAIVNNYCYVANTTSGIQIVDISSPSNPQLVTTYDSLYWASSIIANGSYLYVTDENSLFVLDITNRTNPFKKSFLTQSPAQNLKIKGNYAYFTSGYNGLRIVDISNPDNIIEIGNYQYSGKWIYCVSIYNNYAYIGYSTSAGEKGIVILDISDPANPGSINSFTVTELPDYSVVNNNYLYLCERNNGIKIFDLSNPINPNLSGFYNTPGSPYSIFINSNYLYVADADSGLRIADISNPILPNEMGFYTSSNLYATNVFVRDNLAYLSNGQFGLTIINNNLVTDIKDNEKITLTDYILYQNYPNPFNPQTVIKFRIDKPENVSIEIFNLLGQKIQTILNNKKSAGLHKVIFNADDLSSGVYLYKICAGTFQEIKKMVLIR